MPENSQASLILRVNPESTATVIVTGLAGLTVEVGKTYSINKDGNVFEFEVLDITQHADSAHLTVRPTHRFSNMDSGFTLVTE